MTDSQAWAFFAAAVSEAYGIHVLVMALLACVLEDW